MAGGVTFQRAYTESPVCVPARASLLTGRLPHRSGVFSNTTPLRDGTPTVMRGLAMAGYHTQAIGKMHPFDPPSPYYLQYGPLEIPDPVRDPGELDRLDYHSHSQHRVKWTTPDLDRVRVMRASYDACVSHVDAEIGRILDELARTGLADRTLVIFTADHGEYLGSTGRSGSVASTTQPRASR